MIQHCGIYIRGNVHRQFIRGNVHRQFVASVSKNIPLHNTSRELITKRMFPRNNYDLTVKTNIKGYVNVHLIKKMAKYLMHQTTPDPVLFVDTHCGSCLP